MRYCIFFFCVGIVSATFAIDIAALKFASRNALSLSLLLLLLLKLYRASPTFIRAVTCLAFFIAGLCWHSIWAQAGLNAKLPAHLEGVDLRIAGVVIGLPQRDVRAQQFTFRVLDSEVGIPTHKIILNYYGSQRIRPGQRWRFTVRLNRPHGFRNPGGFDYEGWLFQQGVGARGYVRESDIAILLGQEFDVAWDVRLHEIRHEVRERLAEILGDSPYGPLIAALVLGDRSDISKKHWDLFSATGTNHLFVISGMHIGLISGFCYLVTLLLLRGTRRLMPAEWHCPAQKIAAAVALLAALIYALLAGFTLPTQRAFIMIAVFMLGQLSDSRLLISFRLLCAALIVFLFNPLAIISSGFWLSFTAVIALLSFARPSAESHTESRADSLAARLSEVANHWLRPQFLILIALALPLIVFNGQLSLIAPLINIVAIPVVGFFLVPLCFVALAFSYAHESIAVFLLSIAEDCLSLLLQFMAALSTGYLDRLNLQITTPSSWQLLPFALAALLCLLPRAVCRKSLVLPLLLPLISVSPSVSKLTTERRDDDLFALHILDVGQGLAVVVQTGEHALVYDTGARLGPDFDLGKAVVVPALRAMGIRELDTLVISHADNDHLGGLASIVSSMPVRRLYGPSTELPEHSMDAVCAEGISWNWEGVTFRFLNSGLDLASENDNSCVLQIQFAGLSVLLPGDVERLAEQGLVSRYGDALKSTVLIAPHHGSNTSSSYALLKHVRPDFVVFSAGYNNSFSHPHKDVRARYGEFAVTQYSTADAGMVSFVVPIEQSSLLSFPEPVLYREKKVRYWH